MFFRLGSKQATNLVAGLVMTFLICEAALAQLTGAEAGRAVIDWSTQRYSVLEQSAYVPLRLQAALDIFADFPDGRPQSSEDFQALDDAINTLVAARGRLNAAFADLPPPPILADEGISRRLNDSLPVMEDVSQAAQATYDSAIGWLTAVREGQEPPVEDFVRLFLDAQIAYLDALLDLHEVSKSNDQTNPATLDATQTAAIRRAQRVTLVLSRADFVGDWTEELRADSEAELESIREEIVRLAGRIRMRAAEQIANLDNALEAEPSPSPSLVAFRDVMAEIATTYDVNAEQGLEIVSAIDEFLDFYSEMAFVDERQSAIEALSNRIRSAGIRNNEARSRRNLLSRDLARLMDDL
tara:strand:- start:245 stop:1309 length:1065 start_codon:yes stop_codon:yes gene_type:complete